MNPRIAFCITCKNRAQHLKETLPRNLIDNIDYANCIFIVLDYGSTDDVLPWVKTLLHSKLVVYSFPVAGKFQMAHAKNMAHRLGMQNGAEILVNLDADNFTGAGFASHIASVFEANPNAFLWARMVQRCHVCPRPRNHAGDHGELLPEDEIPRSRGISGRIVVGTEAFLKTGGYDEKKYAAWGPDDRDFNQRLQLLGYQPVEIPGQFLSAVHHGPKLRFREYPHAELSEAAYDPPGVLVPGAPAPAPPAPTPITAVVNFGRIGVGGPVMSDGVGFGIAPVPTRIFGIGMHKTGTTSLDRALQILGYESVHWPTPRWARTVWEEMTQKGKSLTLEQHYAATDFPITLLYKELDRAYPGSKFILTVRNAVDWLESVEDHWDYLINRWRKDWDWDCFSHKMHNLMYGRKTFHVETFLDRYIDHNNEVLEYFEDRPNDLLVMTMGLGWGQLCKFLGKPVPIVPYPRENAR